nr:MAG TPA: hypothetical protein [Caudoviricetes sp.]
MKTIKTVEGTILINDDTSSKIVSELALLKAILQLTGSKDYVTSIGNYIHKVVIVAEDDKAWDLAYGMLQPFASDLRKCVYNVQE